jgi:hypothetical protein
MAYQPPLEKAHDSPVTCIMKKLTLTTEFRVTQFAGSMAIDGIRVSAETRSKITRIINGEVNTGDLRQELVKRYSKPIE